MSYNHNQNQNTQYPFHDPFQERGNENRKKRSTNPKKVTGGVDLENKAARKKMNKNKPKSNFSKVFQEERDYSFRRGIFHLDFESMTETEILEFVTLTAPTQLLIHNINDSQRQQPQQPIIPPISNPSSQSYEAFSNQPPPQPQQFQDEIEEDDGYESNNAMLFPSFFTQDEIQSPVSVVGFNPVHLSPINMFGDHPYNEDELEFIESPSPLEDEGKDKIRSPISPDDPFRYSNFPNFNNHQHHHHQQQQQQQQQQHYFQNNNNQDENQTQFFAREERLEEVEDQQQQQQQQNIIPPPPPQRQRQGGTRHGPEPNIDQSVLTKKARTSKVRIIKHFQREVNLVDPNRLVPYPWLQHGGIVLENCYDGISVLKIFLGCEPRGQDVRVNFKVFRVGYIRGNKPTDLKIVILESPEELFGPKTNPNIFRPCKKKVKKKCRSRNNKNNNPSTTSSTTTKVDIFFDNPRQEVSRDGVLTIEYRLNNFVSPKTKGINLFVCEVFVNNRIVRHLGYYFKKDNRTEAKSHILHEPHFKMIPNFTISSSPNHQQQQQQGTTTMIFDEYDPSTEFFGGGNKEENKKKEETDEMKKVSMFITRMMGMVTYQLQKISKWEERELKNFPKKNKKLEILKLQLNVLKKVVKKSNSLYRNLEKKMNE